MITIIYAHPYRNHSRAGEALIASVKDLPRLEIRDLYDLYPDFHIDAKSEQEQLLKADLIVLQHPLHWYHTPALLSLWFEKVLTFGWAYGDGAQALKGKRLLWAVTAGGDEASYGPAGYNHFPFSEIARPLQQTALFCGMEWLDPVVVFGAAKMDDESLFRHGENYRDRLTTEMLVNHSGSGLA